MNADQKHDLSSLRIAPDKRNNDRPRSKWWIWIVVAVAVVALIFGYTSLKENVTPSLSVKLSTVSYMTGSDASAELVATGYVVAHRLAEVASKGTGRLDYIGFDEGDTVAAGQLIANLENNDIRAALALAEANLEVAEVDTLNAGRSFRRQQTLLSSGSITEEIYELAEAAYLASLANVKGAAASVEMARVDLENTYIRAPFSGTVLTKNAEVGEIVAPFASSASSKGSVVTLADMKSLEVEADVNEANINKVSTGQRCEIILDAYPSVHYPGFVKKIVPTADRSRATVLTRVAFAELDERVLPEMSARINFFLDDAETDTGEPTLTVSRDAVTTRDGQRIVFVVKETRATAVPVELGRQLGDRTEVLAGLSPGDRVVLSPPGKLTSGDKVEYTP